jgi:hypothetical protein
MPDQFRRLNLKIGLSGVAGHHRAARDIGLATRDHLNGICESPDEVAIGQGTGRGTRSTSVVKGSPLDNSGVSLRADVSVANERGSKNGFIRRRPRTSRDVGPKTLVGV